MHCWDFHGSPDAIGAHRLRGREIGGLFQPAQAFPSTAKAVWLYWAPDDPRHAGNRIVAGFYAIGIWAVCYHLANGLATSAMAWGITVTPATQRRWSMFCLAIGASLSLTGMAAWWAFAFVRQTG